MPAECRRREQEAEVGWRLKGGGSRTRTNREPSLTDASGYGSVPMAGFGGLTTVPLGDSGGLTTVPMAGFGDLTTVPLGVWRGLTTVPIDIRCHSALNSQQSDEAGSSVNLGVSLSTHGGRFQAVTIRSGIGRFRTSCFRAIL
jgi:hypothetical protein